MFKTTAYASAAVIAGSLFFAPVQVKAEIAPAAARTIFACQARAGETAMHARYELRSGRRKFTAEFQSVNDPRFVAGGRLSVTVEGVRVGAVVLDALSGGGVVGDLNFDTQPQIDAKPFPANWPIGVGGSSPVNFMKGPTIVLGCTLRRL